MPSSHQVSGNSSNNHLEEQVEEIVMQHIERFLRNLRYAALEEAAKTEQADKWLIAWLPEAIKEIKVE